MTLVVIAGAPGAGKTTLLAELARLGHHTVSDSAREVIRERKARGLPPRPGALEFASEILRRDVDKYHAASQLSGPVFFERCGLEALAMQRAARPRGSSLPEPEAPRFVFHEQVFLLPPWEAIYVTDAERDHDFEHALRVHEELVAFYPALGYTLAEVPRGSPGERADHVLRALAMSVLHTPDPHAVAARRAVQAVPGSRPVAINDTNDIIQHPIHLGLGASASVEPHFTGAMEWYEDYERRHASDGAEGRLVGMHSFTESWSMWELHPLGSEVVLCTSGSITVHQELADGTVSSAVLGPGQYVVNPPGTWHTADVDGHATAVFITAGLGTRHRPR